MLINIETAFAQSKHDIIDDLSCSAICPLTVYRSFDQIWNAMAMTRNDVPCHTHDIDIDIDMTMISYQTIRYDTALYHERLCQVVR